MIFVLSSMFNVIIKPSNRLDFMTIYSYPLYSDSVYDINYEWKGTIVEEISVELDNGIMPTTYFLVDVIYSLDENFNKQVLIEFHGGYKEDKLYLFDGMSYPLIGESYYFHNSILSKKDEYDLFIVEAPHQMISIENITPSNSIPNSPPEQDDGGGGGGNYYNTSFETAQTITLNYKNTFVRLYYGQPRFYKFSIKRHEANGNNVIVMYTKGILETELIFYNQNFNQISVSYQVFNLNTNSQIIFTNLTAQTYYLKVSNKNQTDNSITELHVEFDRNEIYAAPMETIETAVVNNKLIYKSLDILDSEINCAAIAWNRLSPVLIEKENIPFSANLKFTSKYAITNTIGKYTYAADISIIELNLYYFQDLWSDSEKRNNRINAIIHELGHALGLVHEPGEHIMAPYASDRINLAPLDIIRYNRKWKGWLS